MVRAPFYDESGLKKGAWSQEEDDKLRDYIQKYGHWNWRELPKFAGLSRCGKSCRLRWMNYLRPEVKRGNYTKEEEDTILRLHADLGNKWSMIAAQLPGRTDNEIKNYWHTHLKNRGKKHKKASNEEEMESDGTSEYGGSQSRKSESANFLASMTSLHILESSPFTPESTSYHQIIESSPLTPESTSYHQVIESSPLSDPETSSTTYYSSTSNWEPLPQMNWVSETSSDSYAQFSGDFWTEPFVPDNSYIPPDREYLSDGPYLSSPYNSDSMDFFNYHQLPEDSAYI